MKGAGWARYVWMIGLPPAVVGCFLYIRYIVPRPSDDMPPLFMTHQEDVWFGNLVFGLVELVVFLLLEPILVVARWFGRWLEGG